MARTVRVTGVYFGYRAAMKLVVGDRFEDPVDIGPALAVLGAKTSTPAKIRSAMKALRWDLFVRNQGNAGYGSVETVPHMIMLLGDRITPAAQAAILELLAELHPASELTEGPEEELADAVDDAREKAIALLASTDLDVRVQAARLCAFVSNTGSTIAKRLAVEKDPIARATLLFAAARQGVAIDRALLDDKNAIVRTAAALAAAARKVSAFQIFAFDDAALADERIAAVLARAVDDKKLGDTSVPFFEGDLRSQARRALPEPEPAPRIDDGVKEQLFAAIVGTTYAPGEVLGALAGELRIDAALDLLEDRGDVARHWTYGDETNHDIVLAERRRARMYDLCVQLVDGADAPARIEREIERLIAEEAAAVGRDVAKGDSRRHPFQNARAVLALAGARRLVRAGQPIPEQLVAQLGHVWGCGEYFRDICCDAVVARFGGVGKYGDALWWLADLSPVALAAVTRLHVAKTKEGWQGVELLRAHVERWIAACDAKALEPLFADAAKRTAKGTPFAWRGYEFPVDDTPPATARSL
jgi:hypothetical protein